MEKINEKTVGSLYLNCDSDWIMCNLKTADFETNEEIGNLNGFVNLMKMDKCHLMKAVSHNHVDCGFKFLISSKYRSSFIKFLGKI